MWVNDALTALGVMTGHGLTAHYARGPHIFYVHLKDYRPLSPQLLVCSGPHSRPHCKFDGEYLAARIELFFYRTF